MQEAEEAQRKSEETARYLGQAMSDAVGDLLVEGRSLSDVFDNLAKSLAKAAIQALLLGNGPLAGLLGGGGGSAGGVGGIIGSLFGLKFAKGGAVSGPGTGTSDSIPARLSNGEFVVNAAATSDNRALLEALNQGLLSQDDLAPRQDKPAGQSRAIEPPKDLATRQLTLAILGNERSEKAPRLPTFADGGHVRGPGTGTSDSIDAKLSAGEFVVRASSVMRNREILERINSGEQIKLPAFAAGGFVGGRAASIPRSNLSQAPGRGGNATVNISAPVTVNAAGGTPQQNADLATQMAKAMDATMRGTVCDEIRRQMRPGGMFNILR